jgi:multicomponent Na+:H+ antiporter subunit D
VTQPLAALAAVTIIYGSLRALTQDDIKRRLAFSTVSQVSYITLGVALGSPIAAIGALAHLIHQGLMKITMFMAAGNLAEGLGVKKVSQMRRRRPRMPGTMAPSRWRRSP